MVARLGKRKRRDELVEDDAAALKENVSQDTAGALHIILRQHFEATFEPLDDLHALSAAADRSEVDVSDSGLDSDWEGILEEQSEGAEVISHGKSGGTSNENVPREELKKFMSAKPPSFGVTTVSTGKRKQVDSADIDDASADAANLKKDLALQRLLKESHLLDPQSSLVHSGRNRHKALDLRLQDLGSRSSIFQQQNMPLTQRKGIKTKAAEREENRRRMAQENGIILDKAVKSKKRDESKRQRGIGAPSVGKFQGGMLKLSKKDIATIEGPKRTVKGRK